LKNFLEKIASHLIETYADNVSDICIVLPNKRAGLFLKEHLSKLIDKPIWLPEILGAEELIERLSELEVVDNISQLFELYEVYKKTIKDPEPFEDFSKWGQILLHDFNEIDRYLIPTEKLFKHINEVRALEVWNLGEREITEFQAKYLKFWNQLGDLYQKFNAHLNQNELAYQGQAFRKVAEEIMKNPEGFVEEKIKWDKIVFVGFNALNNAEETIITKLIKQNKAEIIWDADEYYLNDKMQESGIFLRKFKEKEVFTPFSWISNKFEVETKRIDILGVPQNIGQAKYITNIISELDGSNNYKDTVVVLADENLLVPVLQSVPEEVENINVTMGYPLRSTPINNFFEIFFTTLLNAERFGHKGKLTYHYNDILKLIQLPFSRIIFGAENCDAIKKQIINNNWVFINKDKLNFINDKLPIKLAEEYSISEILKQCKVYIEEGKNHFVAKKEENGNVKLELEYLFHYAKLFNQLTRLTTKYPVLETIKAFYSIYHQILSGFAIDLYGEPLKGLQVMGMLETRNVDFDNVILLSTNEGVLPAGKSFNSFIPFDVKKAYKLPTHMEKDAVYAYHFYRLIQNAKNITILYNTETDEFGSGEQSRFVTQIENELKDFENISISKQIIQYPTVKSEVKHQVIEKTPDIIQKIKQHFERGISPSALITYINCPLDYYYKYVLGLRESDEVEEAVSHSTFGSYVHKVLELLYTEFRDGKTNVTEANLKELLKLVPETTKKAFSKDFSERELMSGKNLLTYNVALNYVNTFIKNEIQFVNKLNDDLYIKALEKELNASLVLKIKEGDLKVNLRGNADRIDAYGDTIRIIDYKTGLVKPTDLGIVNFEELSEVNKKNKALQILMYAYMYAQNNGVKNIDLVSGIISFRKLSSGFMPFKIGVKKDAVKEIDEEIILEFESLLAHVFENMIDIEQPFTHQHEAKYCDFCGQ